MSGVYLTFNQGVTQLIDRNGREKAYNILQKTTDSIRPIIRRLKTQEFSFENDIDLKTEVNRGKAYEYSTIAYKLYKKDSIPNDEILLQILITYYKLMIIFCQPNHLKKS